MGCAFTNPDIFRTWDFQFGMSVCANHYTTELHLRTKNIRILNLEHISPFLIPLLSTLFMWPTNHWPTLFRREWLVNQPWLVSCSSSSPVYKLQTEATIKATLPEATKENQKTQTKTNWKRHLLLLTEPWNEKPFERSGRQHLSSEHVYKCAHGQWDEVNHTTSLRLDRNTAKLDKQLARRRKNWKWIIRDIAKTHTSKERGLESSFGQHVEHFIERESHRSQNLGKSTKMTESWLH